MVDVAQRAGVSVGTVSNVLNRPDRVSTDMRERVLAAIDELGFVRNEAARQLRAGRSRTIGLLVLDLGNPFFTDIAAGVETAAAAADLAVVLCDSGDDAVREDRYLAMLHEQRCFGILMTPVTGGNARIAEVRRHGTPVVFVDRGSSRRWCSTSVDDRVGGRLAADHLLQLGHRWMAFVGGPLATRQVADRLAGAREAWALAGRTPASLTILETANLNVAAGREAGARLMALPRRSRPTAVFCANDLLAFGVLQHLTQQHLSVPEDLAIVGYDDIDFASAAAVPLTSVAQPRAQLGSTAAELLIDEVSGGEGHRHRQLVFEPELVVRASTQA